MKWKIILIWLLCMTVLLWGCTYNQRKELPQENWCIIYQCAVDWCNPNSYVRCPLSTTTAERTEMVWKISVTKQVVTTEE